MCAELAVFSGDDGGYRVKGDAILVKLQLVVVSAKAFLKLFERSLLPAVDFIEEVLAGAVEDFSGLDDITAGKLFGVWEVSAVDGKQDRENKKTKNAREKPEREKIFQKRAFLEALKKAVEMGRKGRGTRWTRSPSAVLSVIAFGHTAF